MIQIWLLEFTRWPGYDEYMEIVGVYSSMQKAKEAVPYSIEWKLVTPNYSTERAVDINKDIWMIYPITLDAPIEVTFPTWTE